MAAVDPIFGLIAEHKRLFEESLRLYSELDTAESQAGRTHGKQPSPYIAWRNRSTLDGELIDDAREKFLRQPGADSEQIEKEYQDAKARLADAKRAGGEWDRRTGIAPLRNQCELASRAENEAAMRMARMKPTTPAGAGALIDLIRRELVDSEPSDWMMTALETAAAALAEMRAPITLALAQRLQL